MKIVRVYTGSDEKSHFEEIEMPYVNSSPSGETSQRLEATGIIFRRTAGDYNYDFHPAPRRQFVINLKGGVEIEVGGGDKRRLGPGDILLAEDTTGQGHISRAIDNQPRLSIFVTLD